MGSFPDEVPLRKGRMALLAYDLSPEGTATFRKILVDYAPQDGPDGMVVDAEGNLWVAVRDETRPGVRAYSPEGEELAYVKTPDKPTNVAFGRGKTSETLYITAENCLYSIQTMKKGVSPAAKVALLFRSNIRIEVVPRRCALVCVPHLTQQRFCQVFPDKLNAQR